MTIDAPTTAKEMPMLPAPGEIRFSINLALIDDIPALYQMLDDLGFTPQIVWTQNLKGIEIHALIHQEIRAELTEYPEMFEEEKLYLVDRINPDALRFICCFTKSLSMAA